MSAQRRQYGDSRARSPALESYRRDLARLHGWNNDFVVAMTIDIDTLRAFQSRAKRWPDRDDLFKPMPSGFKVGSARKRLPP